MTPRKRYVFDTNVMISALMFVDSKPGQAFLTALAEGEILLSLAVLHELRDVLRRPKFNRYLLREERELFLAALIREATVVEVTEVVQVCRDPKDDKFLALALSGRATSIISGDDDLLRLSPFRGIPIFTPEAFLTLFSTPPASEDEQEIP